jgi:predicted Rossmann fold nucleotide-binding protein DprA/Smf involved in DNA uptake
VVAYDSEVTVPVGYLALPEPPAEDDHGKPGEPWVYADLPPETDNDDDDAPRERDDRGRKVITRDHSWRDKTLATVRAAGTSGVTVEALAAQLQVSGGALQMRLARLRRDGLVERINRSWRTVEVAS